jgi:dipeptidyl aminopeptidase/acylaminoacyl peptidase
MKRWLKVILWIVVVVVVVVLAGVTMLTKSEGEKLVTCSEREISVETPADYGLLYEDVTVTTADGLKLVGWYIPSGNRAAVMLQNGYMSVRQRHLLKAAFLNRHGYGVLLTTTRCHDGSEGDLITWGRDEMMDLEAWYQYLLTREDVGPDRIGMMGESFGGAMSIKYAAENPRIRAVISEGAFASLEESIEIGIGKFVPLPPPVLSLLTPMIVFWAEQRASMDVVEVKPVDWIKGISPRPVFILHGGLDDYAGGKAGGQLYDAAGEPVEFWPEPECGHADFDECEAVPPAEYEERLVGFFDRYLLGQ